MWEHGVAPGHYLCNGLQKKYTAMNQIQFITDVLRENVSAYSHVESFNQALGNRDGLVKLTTESATQNTRVLLEKGETQINKLDSLGYDKIDLIKIDVEGLEMEVLKGATKILNNVEYLMIELNGNSEKYGSSKKI